MSIRHVCASTVTAIGLTCSSTSFARVVVYMSAPVAYAPPPRPVYYYVPVQPAYVMTPPPVAVHVAAPVAPPAPTLATQTKPAPLQTTVVVPATTNYAVVATPAVTYAQPVVVVPRLPRQKRQSCLSLPDSLST